MPASGAAAADGPVWPTLSGDRVRGAIRENLRAVVTTILASGGVTPLREATRYPRERW
jgi:hypothetical protein